MGQDRQDRRYRAARQATGARPTLAGALTQALAAAAFDLHYQPVMDLVSGCCVGVEALIRWTDPIHGVVDPEQFIALAERIGLIVPMTRWLLRRVRDDFDGRHDFGPGFHLGFNLAPAHLAHDSLESDLQSLHRHPGLRGARIIVEITERTPVAARHRPVLDRLRTQGFSLAIDDFGTGHAGLNALLRFRFDCLKIDQSFVAAIGQDGDPHLVMEAIIALAHRMGLTLIAEGVETPAQRAYLAAAGVRLAQGYLFSKPLSYKDLTRFHAVYGGGPLGFAAAG